MTISRGGFRPSPDLLPRAEGCPHPDHSPSFNPALCGLAVLLIVLGAFWAAGAQLAEARQSPIVFAPQEWSLQGAWMTEVDQGRVTVGMKRAVPVYTLLPQTTPGSRVDAMRIRGGIRSDDSGVDPRFRITAVDLDIQKMYKSASVTLIDVDASGQRDVAARWLGIGFGPGYTVQRFDRSFEIRVQARTSIQTVEFGRASFPGLSDGAADRRTTLEYGAKGMLLIRAVDRLAVFARGTYSMYLSDVDPVWAAGAAGLRIKATPAVSFEAFGSLSAVDGVSSDDSRSEIGFSIRYTREQGL